MNQFRLIALGYIAGGCHATMHYTDENPTQVLSVIIIFGSIWALAEIAVFAAKHIKWAR